MRPVTLTIEGFGCYRESQEIDFSRCKVFAISGPTGAGKSSLLDAVTFALYGKIPRLGGQNLDEFISLGAARASILLDFDLRGERYRIARTMQRTGAKKAQLEQITGGVQKSLGDSTSEINSIVTTLLGLDYEAFKQSVLLPQGEFASFLKSTSGNQQKILQNLLRLGVYEKMRDRASSEGRDLQGQIETAQKVLDGPYALATPDELRRTEEKLVDVGQKKDAASKAHTGLRTSLQDLRAKWALTKERQTKHGRLGECLKDELAIDNLKTSLDRARKALLVIPCLDSFRERVNAVAALNTKLSGAETAVQNALQEASTNAAELSVVEGDVLSLPVKRSRIEQLAALTPIIEEHSKSKSHRTQLDLQLTRASSALPSNRERLSAAELACQQEDAKRTALLKKKSDSGYDAIAHSLLKSAQRPAFELAEAKKVLENLRRALTEARNGETTSEGLLLSETAKLQAADEAHLQSESAKNHAADRLLAAQNQERAAALKATLAPGCACPVCEQPVETIPPISVPADLAAAKLALEAANKQEGRTRKLRDTANGAAAGAAASLELARKAVGDLQSQFAAGRQQIQASETALTTSLSVVGVPSETIIEDFVEAELARFDRLHADFQALEAALGQAALAHQTAATKAQTALRDLKDNEGTVATLTNEVAAADTKIRSYAESITAAGSENPTRELESIRAEILVIEERHKRQSQLAHDCEIKVKSAEQTLTDLRALISSTIDERDHAEGIATKAISTAGFTTAAEVRGAALSDAAIGEAEARVVNFADEVKQLRTRIGDIDTQLAGAIVAESDVLSAEQAESEVGELVRSLDGQEGGLNARLTRLREDTQAAECMRAEQSARQARYTVVHELARDLKSDGFQRHLLEGSFRRLVAGASTRLHQLNSRFELVLDTNKIAVRDHDHGAQLRLADTLSGGETFLVSLSLALELSEQVQQAAGAVRLDSIFIDEGFGTLDPETLETVADAIESLGQTNRMVGVITHVAELHRRLPRLEVTKGVSGSTVRYVED
jgi:DNA repair protein SbcC/Rad50